MVKIAYIEDKVIDWTAVQSHLQASSEKNHWANFGPAVCELEDRLEKTLKMPENCGVVTFSSGTTALHALVELLGRAYDKPWAVSSFGFYCTKLGPLADAVVVDCDARGMLNLNKIPDPCEIGGLVVTNTFGLYDLKPYVDYCKLWGLNLICDAATALDAEHLPNSIISFHHTKPWGFGEGGCAIVNQAHKEPLKAYSNFGVLGTQKILDKGTNCKMSDLSAAFILNRLDSMDDVRKIMKEEYVRIAAIAKGLGYVPMATEHPGCPCNVPLIAPVPIDDAILKELEVPLRKYYIPLSSTPAATFIYDRILNFPCHPGLNQLGDDDISQVLQGLIS
jgi:dTDP-4-amino-4,6-dideoxygalactose transaminase